MLRFIMTVGLATVFTLPLLAQDKNKPADKPKSQPDSPIVMKTKEKLEAKISVDFKDTQLKDVLEELGNKAEVIFRRDNKSIPGHKSITYTGKDKMVKDVLHEIFKDHGLGYIVHRKENAADRYEGYVDVVQGDQRGDEVAAKPDPKKPTTPAKPETDPKKPDPKKDDTANTDEQNEKEATARLKRAQQFFADGQKEDAKDYCEIIVKKYANTKAAKEAKELLEKLKK